MMNRLIPLLFISLLTVGCAEVIVVGHVVKAQYHDFFSDAFDNTEYEHLVKLNLAAGRRNCEAKFVYDMRYHADFLYSWSTHRNNANIHDIYKRIKGLTDELHKRGSDVSKAYCDIKTQTIDKVTKRILEVYGKRR